MPVNKNRVCIVCINFMIITVMIAAIILMQSSEADAASLSEIRNSISEKQSQLEEGKAEESEMASQIKELEDELYKLQNEIEKGEDKLVTLEEELEKAQEKVNVQNGNLGARLENMYKSGTVGFLDVLLDSRSFSEFLTNLDLVRMIYTSDMEVLEGLQDSYDEIEKKKQEIEKLQGELTASKTVLEDEKSSVVEKKAEISEENAETEAMINEMQAEADRITAELAEQSSSGEISNSNTSSYEGAMTWPTPGYGSGYITSYFGYRLHPVYGTWKLHTGIDIGAPKNARIVAAESGKVIFARKYDGGGYGKYLQIDHGGGIVTLYGHCNSIVVSEGQQVTRGQTIAYVGTTGTSTGYHLHFEVRKNGQYVDPLDYL